jgi:quercetin dioxygenase-like cupin family protein/DNA-binding XRE family transcriptional regulator
MIEDKLDLSRKDFLAAVEEMAVLDNDTLDPDSSAIPVRDMMDRERAELYGERIRAAREWKGFSIDEVALKTGIDKEHLYQVESGDVILPLGLLIKVAKALSLRLADVISRGHEPFTIVREGEGKSVQRLSHKDGGYGYEYESLAPKKKGKTMEPFLVTLYPMERLKSESHEGQEFLYVLDGQVEITIENKTHLLSKGDAIYYDSHDNHFVRAFGNSPAKIVAVLSS